MNKLAELKKQRYAIEEKAKANMERRVKAAEKAADAEEARLREAWLAGKMKEIPGSNFSFAWNASCEAIFEGDVYKIDEVDAAGPQCIGITFERKATADDRKSVRAGKAK